MSVAEPKYRTGWLSPTGEFIACAPYEHMHIAAKILSEIEGVAMADDYYLSRPDEQLLSRGWASIVIMTLLGHGFAFWRKQKLTTEQIQFLEPYYQGVYGLGMVDECKQDYEYLRWGE